MSHLSAVCLLTIILVVHLVLVEGKVGDSANKGKGNGKAKKVPAAAGSAGAAGAKGGAASKKKANSTPKKPAAAASKKKPTPKKLLKCAVCQGKTFEECSKHESSQTCPPGSSDRSCLVSIQHINSVIHIKKQCDKKKHCDEVIKKRSKACLEGDVSKGEPCDFCCDTDDCNKGWPRPQFDEHCSKWGTWGECSAHCGPGHESRNQTCHMEIVGYNLWENDTPVGGVRQGRVTKMVEKDNSSVTFLPKLPKNVTEKHVKWAHQPCQIRPCNHGEKPVIKPLPTSHNDKGAAGGLSASLLFTMIWFVIIWMF